MRQNLNLSTGSIAGISIREAKKVQQSKTDFKMKRIALPLIAAVLTSPAYAHSADAPQWQGYYAGFEVSSTQNGELVFELAPGVTSAIDLDGLQYGLVGGYRYQFADFVVGGEYNFEGGRTDLVGFSGSTKLALHTAGVEVGYAVGRFLPYATAGLAHIRFNGEGGTFTDTGTFAGIGLDYRVRAQATIGVEINTHQFDTLSGTVLPTTPELTTIGLNYTVDF